MTEPEHLLTILGEECCEVAQRVSKTLRFGLDEIQPGQELNNRERLMEELYDLFGTLEELQERGILPDPASVESNNRRLAKREQIKRFLEYAKRLKTVTCEHEPHEDHLICQECGYCKETLDEETETCTECREKLRIENALKESVQLQSHYAELLNMHDGGQRRSFNSPEEWMQRLDEVKGKQARAEA